MKVFYITQLFMLPFLTESLRAASSIQVTHSAAWKPHLTDNLVHQLLTQLSAAHGLGDTRRASTQFPSLHFHQKPCQQDAYYPHLCRHSVPWGS